MAKLMAMCKKMSKSQMHDFATTKEKPQGAKPGLPKKKAAKKSTSKGGKRGQSEWSKAYSGY